MTDERLRENLRRLPEAGAGEGFTRAVLARLADEPTGAEDPAREPGSPQPARWLRSLRLPPLVPRLATAAAVMVVATTLALALVPVLNGTGSGDSGSGHAVEPVMVAESATATEAGPGEETAPARQPAEAAAATVTEATEPEPRRTAATDSEPSPVPNPARDSMTDPAPETVPPVAAARDTPETAAPAEAQRPTAEPRGSEPRSSEPRALDPEERRRAVERLRQLRREQEQLRTRLAALTERPAPTLVLGGDESLELVLDLSADAGPTEGLGGYGAQPASYRPRSDNQSHFH